MLVLTRKEDQSIVIPGDAIHAFKHWEKTGIEIVVVAIDGDRVKIGIDAPDQVDVYRQEVWRQVRREELRKEITNGPNNS